MKTVYFIFYMVGANIFIPHIQSESQISGWAKTLALPSSLTLQMDLITKVSLTPYTHVMLSLPTELDFNVLSKKWLSNMYPVIYSGPDVPLYKRGKREIIIPKRNSSYYLEHPWGERASFFPTILKLLDSLGFDGKNCLLRAICEMHEDSLKSFGLFGEILLLVFSTSKSPLAKTPILKEFLRAEKLGRNKLCEPYHKKCSTSIFQWSKILNGPATF